MNLSAELTPEQTARYLRTLPAVRERCTRVFNLAKEGKLHYLEYHPEKEAEITDFCLGIIQRDFGTDYHTIPPHGRGRHFDVGRQRVAPLVASWKDVDTKESCKRLIDLFVVSALLDAGAGPDWIYTEESTGDKIARSEGLATASIHMFTAGLFSSDPKQPCQVDAEGLKSITVEAIGKHFQVSESNPMVGLEGRTSLVVNLAKALTASSDIFGASARPGNMLDFFESQSKTSGPVTEVPMAAVWYALIDGFNPVWPASRAVLGGVSLGDVWTCTALTKEGQAEGDDFVPFHKLTQWMTYSVIDAIESTLKWKIVGKEDMTGLPEYRNGGLLMDFGLVTLKPGVLPIDPVSKLPKAAATHPAIVEWRAMTVIMLDRISDAIRARLNLTSDQLNLAQVLESATWKGGREIAKQLRPESGGPPMEIESDGTVF